MNHRAEYKNFIDIYTDGSKTGDQTSYSIYCDRVVESYRISNSCSIFTAEALAIHQALHLISNHAHRKFIIYSDSRSVLDSLNSYDHSHPFISDIIHLILNFRRQGYDLCWIPGHVGIKGNEHADFAAKSATIKINFNIPYVDIKKGIRKYFINVWQEEWNGDIGNK